MGRFFNYLGLALFGFMLGWLRMSLAVHEVKPDQVDYYNGQKIEVTGVISEVDIRRDKAKYRIEAEGDAEGSVLITLSKYPQYKYGDRLTVYGELQAPGIFEGFDYGAYLSRFGIYSVMYRPKVTFVDSGNGSFFWAGMSYLQSKFMERINRLFPEPHASFEAGLLVGARKGIPEDLMEKFNITGLTHIIAISGYNITIIIVFVMWMLGGLPRMMGFGVAVGAIILFTLFVGASPAVVRASIMG
ncbi:MAG: ComEC family competence protein, partial [Candidatus Peregrinibacteria bacterium]|nr:ComEC family competence protein [Candidatus Peregrinibacteria bacterium]